MSATPAPQPTPLNQEQGSVTIWMITASLVMTILVGLAVDLGGQVYAEQRAQDLAAQAARAGAEQLNAAAAIRGHGAVVNPSRALAAARAYLDAVPDVTGRAHLLGTNALVVDTTATYRTTFLGLIGINALTVTGHAQAQITRTVGGAAR